MKKKHIHFVGIKGVGMAPLAIIAKEAGFVVSGCDIGEEFITDEPLKKAGIAAFVGFSRDHVQNIDLVITTGAHGGFDNDEVQFARERGIKVLTQGQAVGEFMSTELFNRSFEGISVCGTHGKTTTTAMIATILKENGMDPSYMVGTGSVLSLGSCGHFGKGKFFVAEADEYATEPKYDKTIKFLWQNPKILVITNIEFDHPDLFSSVDKVREAFVQFSDKLDSTGTLITNGDDEQVQKLLRQTQAKRIITFGKNFSNDFVIKKISVSGQKMFFWLSSKGTSLGEFCLNVFGEHNVLNATASIVTALECGLDIEKIRRAIQSFGGSKRRLEYVGTTNKGSLVYDDYAHHPTEIKRTLIAIKKSFPEKKIVCVFEPHTYSRTKYLFEEFIHSFGAADIVVIVDIYPSQREIADLQVSSRLLVEHLGRFHKNSFYLKTYPDVLQYIAKLPLDDEYLIVTMGAGSIYKLTRELVDKQLHTV